MSTLSVQASTANIRYNKQTVNSSKEEENKSQRTDSPKESRLNIQTAKQSLNIDIIHNTLEINSGKALQVASDKWTTKVNEMLEKIYGELQAGGNAEGLTKPGGIENLNADDWTPDKTAQRIVNLTTGLYELYKKRNGGELQGEELLKQFMVDIGSGIAQGYDEAVNYLKAFPTFTEDVQSQVSQTRELIIEKLQSFFESEMEKMNPPQEEGGGSATVNAKEKVTTPVDLGSLS